MVRRVKAGKLCGTIAGLPCLGLRKPESSKKEVEEEGKDQRIQQARGGWVWWLQGVSVVAGREVKGGITMRGGRSIWIDIRESSVRCYTTGKYVQ